MTQTRARLSLLFAAAAAAAAAESESSGRVVPRALAAEHGCRRLPMLPLAAAAEARLGAVWRAQTPPPLPRHPIVT